MVVVYLCHQAHVTKIQKRGIKNFYCQGCERTISVSDAFKFYFNKDHGEYRMRYATSPANRARRSNLKSLIKYNDYQRQYMTRVRRSKGIPERKKQDEKNKEIQVST